MNRTIAAYNIVISPEVGQPAVAGGKIGYLQMARELPGLALQHGPSDAHAGRRLLLIPLVHRTVDLLVPRVPKTLPGADGRVVTAAQQLPLVHVALLLRQRVEDLRLAAIELGRQLAHRLAHLARLNHLDALGQRQPLARAFGGRVGGGAS